MEFFEVQIAVIHPSDIQPVSEFQRSAKACIERIRTTGRPLMLTVNGRASVVVLDAEAYRELIERNGATRKAREEPA